MSNKVYIINGPNLNLLGLRQPHIYGSKTLEDVRIECEELAVSLGLEVHFMQSNKEYELIDWIHEAREEIKGIIINPAAFSHTSIALLDALNTFDGPVLEVHISNIYAREAFRHHSYVSQRAIGCVAGFGTEGYLMSVQKMASLID